MCVCFADPAGYKGVNSLTPEVSTLSPAHIPLHVYILIDRTNPLTRVIAAATA